MGYTVIGSENKVVRPLFFPFMDLLLPLCNVIVLFSFFFRFSVSWRSLVGSCNCVFVFVWLVRLARFRRLVRPSWSALCTLHLGLLQCYETMMSRHSSLLTACEGEHHHIAELQYYGTVRTGPRQTYPYPVSLLLYRCPTPP